PAVATDSCDCCAWAEVASARIRADDIAANASALHFLIVIFLRLQFSYLWAAWPGAAVSSTAQWVARLFPICRSKAAELDLTQSYPNAYPVVLPKIIAG